jgi:hypothetical protein
MKLDGYIVGPVDLILGPVHFSDRVYVAPINDDMLLGLDWVKNQQMIIDIPGNCIRVPDGIIPLCNARLQANVLVPDRIAIPPNSVFRFGCEITRELDDYILEPVNDLKLVMPSTLHEAGSHPLVCMINLGDDPVVLTKDQ